MKRKFTPPTLAEVEAYCKEKDLRFVNAVEFFEYFTMSDWIDSKNQPVLNWKNKAITWNMLNRKKKQMHNEFVQRTKRIEAEKKVNSKPLFTNETIEKIIIKNTEKDLTNQTDKDKLFRELEAKRREMKNLTSNILKQDTTPKRNYQEMKMKLLRGM